MKVAMQTYGFKELQAAFKSMPKEVASQVLVSGVRVAAKVIQDAAIQAAPRGDNENRSKASFIYGRLFRNIKLKVLRKRKETSRAAVVTRGRAFWGDFHNRGTRYQPASRWYDVAFRGASDRAISAMKNQMVKKMNSVAKSAIKRAGAGKK